MIAALPMYDHPGLHAAHDALWAGIRDTLREGGIAAPETLSRGGDIAAEWRDPDLLLGQTCGLPFRSGLHEVVTLVATFDYGLPDTPPGHYRSVFVAAADDPRDTADAFAGAALAYNEAGSHSGWAAPWLTGIGFRPALATGAHRLSARAVAEGRAAIAAIDAITWRALTRFERDVTDRLKVVGRTGAAPGQALITARPALAGALRTALAEGLARLDTGSRAALGLVGVVDIPAADYLAVPIPPDPAALAAAGG